jgi:hypothetical protein
VATRRAATGCGEEHLPEIVEKAAEALNAELHRCYSVAMGTYARFTVGSHTWDRAPAPAFEQLRDKRLVIPN